MGWQDDPVAGGWQSDPVVGQKAPEPAKSTSLWDKIKGIAEAGATVATAIPANVAGNVAGIAQTLTGGQYGTPEGIRQGQEKAQQVAQGLTYQPRTETGQGYLQDLGAVIDKSKIAGLGPTEAMALSGMAGPALRQVENNAIAPVRSAIAQSPEVAMLKQLPSKAAQAVLPMPKPEVAALARKAVALDIPLRPDMLTDNKFARMMGEAFEKIPLAGSRSDARQIAFNRAVMSQIGADRNAVRLTPDVFKNAMETSGSTIGDIAKKTPIKIDANASALLAEQVSQAEKFLPSDIAKVVTNYVKELTIKGGADGVIPGETFRKINSQIGAQVRSSSNGDLRNALTSLQADMHELLTKNISNADDLAKLQTARQQYAIGSTLIPLVAKSGAGDISPQGLMQAVTSSSVKKGYMARGGGDMGDLARIGKLFLKEPPSSGTAERGLTYGALLGGGAVIDPATAGGVYGAANLYNRAGPSMVNGILALDPLRK